MTSQDPRPHGPRPPDDRPQHPKWPTIWLLVGVTLLIFVLAALSSYNRI